MSSLGMNQTSVADNGGPSDTTLRRIIDGEPVGISTATLKKFDDAFGWTPGSAARTLAGGEPNYITQAGARMEAGFRSPFDGIVIPKIDWGPLESVVDDRWNELVTLQDRISRLPAAAALYVSEIVNQMLRQLGEDTDYVVEHQRGGSYYMRRIHATPSATGADDDAGLSNGYPASGKTETFVDQQPPADARQADHDLAARRGPGRTKGEQLQDRDARLGEESQVDPSEEG